MRTPEEFIVMLDKFKNGTGAMTALKSAIITEYKVTYDRLCSVGRPKGTRNKASKLDPHKEEIAKFLKLGVSKSSICKIVGCHAQTLISFIKRNSDYFK